MNTNYQSPIILVTFIYGLAIFFQRLGSYLASLFTDNTIYQNLGENFVGIIFVVVVVSKLNMWSQIYWFSKEGLNKSYLFILPVAYIFLNVGDLYPHSQYDLAAGILSTVFTGFLEEILCRGLVIALLVHFYLKLEKDNVGLRAAIVSSLLFGLVHLVNVFEKPDSLGVIIGQVVYATFIGIGFAACYIKTRSILPLILIHIGINLMGFLTSTPNSPDAQSFVETIPAIIICSPLAIFGVILLSINRNDKTNKPNETITR